MKIKTLELGVKEMTSRLEDDSLDQKIRTELLEKKALYEGEIRRLTKLQWEEDHERVNLDDDR